MQGTDVAHDRGVGLWAVAAVQGLGSAMKRNRLRAVATVQGLGSARQRSRLRARVIGRASRTAEVEGRNAGRGRGSQ